jgi:hypothetical protein
MLARLRWLKVRSWIGAATAFVFALHLLLSGLAIARFASITASTDVFAICHGAGSDGAEEPTAPNKKLPPQGPCILCTLSHACGILPSASAVVTLDAIALPEAFPLSDLGVIAPKTYRAARPRGPPVRTLTLS